MGFEFIDGEKIKPFPLSKHEEKDEYPPMPVVIGSWEFYSLVKNTSNLPKSDIQQNETINNHMNTRFIMNIFLKL
jgi:hypothetical protein